VVSRLGSAHQQYVTASGDTVNVTSRLLEVAKQRTARVIMSDDLCAAAALEGVSADRRETGSISEVTIRGRKNPLRVQAWP